MTRDEAIKAYVESYKEVRRTSAQQEAMRDNAGRRIDCFVALGMLDLDEPESATEKLCKELGWGGMNRAALETALIVTGLKIVEK